jgi:hypothetical protein
MGLHDFVETAKRFQGSPKRSASAQSLEGRSVVIIDAEAHSNPEIDSPFAPGSWQQCKHFLSNPAKPVCKKFGCRCKEDQCPPKFRL